MKKITIKVLIVLNAIFMIACETSDKDKEWGYSLLYMPQAVLSDGGVSNNYNVILTKTPRDTSIIVGVHRSGLEGLKAVSVDLIVDVDSLSQTISIANQPAASSSYSLYKTAKLLPEHFYTIANKITLADGEREKSVELIIHKEQLLNDVYLHTVNNRYVLPLRITNPTRYEINKPISLTMFIFELE